MNFQIGAMAAGGAFLLSFLSGLLGGVPFFDILIRAVVWAVVGFGGSLGIEMLLRSLIPDLFDPPEEPPAEQESAPGQSVNITIDAEPPARGGFVEEVDAEAERPRSRSENEPAASTPAPSPAGEAVSGPAEAEEEMPEIGSFLDAFKPDSEGAEGDEGASASSAPEIGEYAPVESSRSSSSGEVTIDGEAQDPAILAKAVQTVLKRDAQGN